MTAGAPDEHEAAVDRAVEHARVLVELGRHREALELLARARSARPDDAMVHVLAGWCHLALDETGEALAAGNRAVGLAPERELGHRLCARALHDAGRHEEAMVPAAQAVRLAPLDWRTHATYAQCAVTAHGRGREARAAAAESVRLAPDEASSHFTLGLVAQTFHDDDVARAAYRRALALDPQHAQAINNLTLLDGGMRLDRLAQGYAAALRHQPGDRVIVANVDTLAVRFALRVFLVSLVGLVVGLLVAVSSTPDGDTGGRVTPVTVLVGVLLVAGLATYTWRLGRRLPRGALLRVRDHFWRHRALLAVSALAATTLVLALVVCFVPGGAVVGLVALRPLGFACVAVVVGSILSRSG